MTDVEVQTRAMGSTQKDGLLSGLAALLEQVWPNHGTARKFEDKMAAQDFAQDRVFYVVDSVGPIAMARTWHRAILVDGREQMILALASVCTAPDRRGEGMGRAVVSRALEQCADDGPTALFQTGVPDFYRGLGSRTVRNPVTSSVRGARLFWEPYVCIHPGTADWSESAELDLLGSGW